MSYTITEEKSYPQPIADMFVAAVGAVAGLQGKVAKEDAVAVSLKPSLTKPFTAKCWGIAPDSTSVLNKHCQSK